MRNVAKFEECCEKLAATSSRKEKEEILRGYLPDPQIEYLFCIALSPNFAFHQKFPEQDGAFLFEDIDINIICQKLLNRETVEEQYATKLGKWISRVFNKNLNLGVGATTINKIAPRTVTDLGLAEPDEIKFGEGESWQTMIHHLDQPKEWRIMPDAMGIRCLMHVYNGKCYPKPSTGFVAHPEVFDESLCNAFPKHTLLDGRLCLREAQTIQEVYDAYAAIELTPELQSRMFFTVLDQVVPDTDFGTRHSYLMENLCRYWARCDESEVIPNLAYIKPEPINFSSSKQIEDYRTLGCKKIWLFHGKAEHKAGKSREVLSLKI